VSDSAGLPPPARSRTLPVSRSVLRCPSRRSWSSVPARTAICSWSYAATSVATTLPASADRTGTSSTTRAVSLRSSTSTRRLRSRSCGLQRLENSAQLAMKTPTLLATSWRNVSSHEVRSPVDQWTLELPILDAENQFLGKAAPDDELQPDASAIEEVGVTLEYVTGGKLTRR
jgi:hypothetical protein